MGLTFNCPRCDSDTLEEIMSDVTVASVITDINDDGDIEYGVQTNEDGTVDRYQCVSCGFSPKWDGEGNEISEPDQLSLWLQNESEIRRRDEKNGVFPGKEDVAN